MHLSDVGNEFCHDFLCLNLQKISTQSGVCVCEIQEGGGCSQKFSWFLLLLGQCINMCQMYK